MPGTTFGVFGVGRVVTATHGAVVVDNSIEVIDGGFWKVRVFVDE